MIRERHLFLRVRSQHAAKKGPELISLAEARANDRKQVDVMEIFLQAFAAVPAAAVDAEYLRPAASKPSQANAGKVIAEILSLMPAARRDTVLGEIGAGNADLATHVKRALLIFSDLHLRLDEAGAAALLRSVDKGSLLTALKAGRNNAPDAVAFLMANISKRMAEQYEEEMASMAMPDEEAADAAQREIVRATRQLEARNELKLKAPPE